MGQFNLIKDVIATGGGGTGTITVTGTPPATFRPFSAIGAVGTTFGYGMKDATNYEIGIGTVGATANTFTRAVENSSNSDTPVNFAAGADFIVVTTAAQLVAFLTASSTATLTNKRITQRVTTVSYATSSSPTWNTDNLDRLVFNNITGTIVSMTTNLTGTPVAGDQLTIDFISTTGGGSATINYGTAFEASSINMPANLPATVGQILSVYFERNTVTSKWRCVGYA